MNRLLAWISKPIMSHTWLSARPAQCAHDIGPFSRIFQKQTLKLGNSLRREAQTHPADRHLRATDGNKSTPLRSEPSLSCHDENLILTYIARRVGDIPLIMGTPILPTSEQEYNHSHDSSVIVAVVS